MSTDTETLEAAADPILTRAIRLLPVKLTDDEVRKKGLELAGVCDDIGTETARADSVKQELKARMGGLESKRAQLATLLRRGDELREVEVLTRAHYASGTASEVRTDTGEVLLARPLTEKERQPSLLAGLEETAVVAGAAMTAFVAQEENGAAPPPDPAP